MKFSKYNLIFPSKKKDYYYLFNTFNGSCFEVDNVIAKSVEKYSMDDLKEETKELFVLSGIIIPENKNEDNILAYNQGHCKYSKLAYVSTVLLTQDCNLRCAYCSQGLEKGERTMTMEQADMYIGFTLESAEKSGAKSITINLFGGEPLMNKEVGFYILEKIKFYCEENGVNFIASIVTNGTLLDMETIEKLHNLNCRLIQITLDGMKKVHDRRRMYVNGDGSFDEIINVLRLLNKKDDMFTAIRVNVDKTNIKETFDLLDYIGKNGEALTNCAVDFGIVRAEGVACSGYSNNCFVESEIGDLLYELWNYAEKQGFRCKVRLQRRYLFCGLYCENNYTVDPELDVYKCWHHVGVKKHLMGRIDEHHRFVDQTPAFFEWMTVDPFKNDDCKTCIYLPTCGGGCGAAAYEKAGSYHANGCVQVKGVVEKQVMKFVEDIMRDRSHKVEEVE